MAAIGASIAPAPAFARGGGHGGGGHGSGGHGGSHAGAGRGGGGGPRGGGTRDGHGSGSSRRGSVDGSRLYGGGRIYPWVPPPIVLDGSRGLQCSGVYVATGDHQDDVFRACGEPTSTRRVVYATRDAEVVVEVWSYERPNTARRTLRFENGVLTSIDVVGPLIR
jgi:hypothetical protein